MCSWIRAETIKSIERRQAQIVQLNLEIGDYTAVHQAANNELSRQNPIVIDD